MMPFLSLEEASFRLGERVVFDRTSWIFHRGQHWAIVGPNSSGKSVFADAIRGQIPLVHGQVQYHFRPVSGLTPEESIAHVAFETRKEAIRGTVVQSRWNSIEEESALNVREFLSYERVNEINPFEVTDRHAGARVEFQRHQRRAFRLLRLGPILDRRLISLSNGETQRVQLARALSRPMRLLVLDEPFAGLDAATRAEFRQALDHLMGTPLRVLLITTRLEDLPPALTHVLYVKDCRVAAAGSRNQLFKDSKLRGLLSRPSKSVRSLGGPKTGPNFVEQPPLHKRGRNRSALARPRGGTPLVGLYDVTVRYGETAIVRKIDWTIRAGESWALLGPNGSGKSTLLSLIMGDNPQAYSNRVVVFGRRRGTGESLWHLKEHIGWVSPELHLHFDESATCLEAVVSGFHQTMGLFEASTRRQREAARHWLERVHLGQWSSTPLYELSLGLQRMVFLARALVKQPWLLILDEPCQGLDVQHRVWLNDAVEKFIRSRLVTAIYVTHRLEEIPKSIQRVFRLSEGRGTAGFL